MVRGFYQLGAGMLTQNQILGVTSSNIANAKTNGYKKQQVMSTSFGEMVLNRLDGRQTQLGSGVAVRTADETATIHSQGILESTDRALDFAIRDKGFFAVQTPNGLQYTRKGSFNLDDQGYLIVKGGGRVMGQNGPILLGTDKVTMDNSGNIYANGNLAGKPAIYDFADYNTLREAGEGFYTATGAPTPVRTDLLWKTIEGSNVNMSQEVTNAMAAQRELQSCSQMLKMYDQILAKATTEIGRA